MILEINSKSQHVLLKTNNKTKRCVTDLKKINKIKMNLPLTFYLCALCSLDTCSYSNTSADL